MVSLHPHGYSFEPWLKFQERQQQELELPLCPTDSNNRSFSLVCSFSFSRLFSPPLLSTLYTYLHPLILDYTILLISICI